MKELEDLVDFQVNKIMAGVEHIAADMIAIQAFRKDAQIPAASRADAILTKISVIKVDLDRFYTIMSVYSMLLQSEDIRKRNLNDE